MLVSISDLVTYMDISLTNRQQDAADLVLAGLQSELETFLGRPIEVDEFTETHVIPSESAGYPDSTFFYDMSLDTTGRSLSYALPAALISLRQTPVISVTSVALQNIAQNTYYLSEALRREANITAVNQSGTNVTYTASGHGFTKGQKVTVTGLSPSGYNINAKEISSVTSTTFTVGSMPTGIGAASDSSGLAVATGNDYRVMRYGLELYRGLPNDVVSVTYTGGLDGDNISMFKLMILRAATREMQNMHDDVVGIKDIETRNVAPLETGFLEKELLAMRKYRRRRI